MMDLLRSPLCLYVTNDDTESVRIKEHLVNLYTGKQSPGRLVLPEWIEAGTVPETYTGTYGTLFIESAMSLMDEGHHYGTRLRAILSLLNPRSGQLLVLKSWIDMCKSNDEFYYILAERYSYQSKMSVPMQYTTKAHKSNPIQRDEVFDRYIPLPKEDKIPTLFITSSETTGIIIPGHSNSVLTISLKPYQPITEDSTFRGTLHPPNDFKRLIFDDIPAIWLPDNGVDCPSLPLKMLHRSADILVDEDALRERGYTQSVIDDFYSRITAKYVNIDNQHITLIVRKYDPKNVDGFSSERTLRVFKRKYTSKENASSGKKMLYVSKNGLASAVFPGYETTLHVEAVTLCRYDVIFFSSPKITQEMEVIIESLKDGGDVYIVVGHPKAFKPFIDKNLVSFDSAKKTVFAKEVLENEIELQAHYEYTTYRKRLSFPRTSAYTKECLFVAPKSIEYAEITGHTVTVHSGYRGSKRISILKDIDSTKVFDVVVLCNIPKNLEHIISRLKYGGVVYVDTVSIQMCEFSREAPSLETMLTRCLEKIGDSVQWFAPVTITANGKKNPHKWGRLSMYSKIEKTATSSSSSTSVSSSVLSASVSSSSKDMTAVRGKPPPVTSLRKKIDTTPLPDIVEKPVLKPFVKRTYTLVDVEHCTTGQPPKITLEEYIKEIESQEFLERYYQQLLRLYDSKIVKYTALLNESKRVYESTLLKVKALTNSGATPECVKESYPHYSSDGAIILNLQELLKSIQSRKESLDITTIREGLKDGVFNPLFGLASIIGREDVKELIIQRIYSFSRSWNFFGSSFNNYVIMGPSGVGKTAIAKVIAYVYCKSHLYATDNLRIVTRADLTGQYVGQTAPRARSIMMSCLEGVMFMEEAYGFFYSTYGNDFGHEIGSELVYFLDKYIGLSTTIAAGYEEDMKEKFFTANKGMKRRFPNVMTLKSYTASELSDIFLRRVEEMCPDILITDTIANVVYSCISSKEHPNQAGDMLNYADTFVRLISSAYGYTFGENEESDIRMVVSTLL